MNNRPVALDHPPSPADPTPPTYPPPLPGPLRSTAAPPPSRLDRLLARYTEIPPWVVVTQLFFGLGWLRAVGEKVIDPAWWNGDVIRGFVATTADLTLPWLSPLLSSFVLPLAPLVAVLVVVAQAAAGVALVSNRAVIPALAVAAALNLVFLASGAVAPSAFYLLGQGAVALWRIGRRPPTPALSRGLQAATVAAAVLAIISLPFVGTVHPAEVIHDPAIMLATLAGLVAVASELTHRALFRRGLP